MSNVKSTLVPDGSGWVLMAYVPIGVGASETPTPTGRTRITKRVLDPQWTHPVTKQVFAPDDPGNLLGGYWVALDPEGIGKQGIGLHGYTGDTPQAWLEKRSSNGCVRLLQPDMDRLFHLALEGTSLPSPPRRLPRGHRPDARLGGDATRSAANLRRRDERRSRRVDHR